MSKICSKCKLEKTIDRFSKRKDGKEGYRRWCKDCAKVNSQEQRLKDPAKYKEVDRKSNSKLENRKRRKNTASNWVKENPDKHKDTILKRYYNITLIDYNILFSDQGGCCAICNSHQDQLKSPLCVDHNHVTGKVRGLLCKPCNSGIGFLKDNKDLCLKAYGYLNEQE